MRDEVYYLADQFGCKFVRVSSVNDKFVNVVRCPSLNHLINNAGEFFSRQKGKFVCDKQQINKSIFNKSLKEFSYNRESKTPFRGCIRIPDYVIDSITLNESVDISDLPYLEISYGEVMAKKVDDVGYRTIKLDVLLSH